MAHPVVLHANHFQFAAGQSVENPRVGSRMLLWCRQGRGTIESDGVERRLLPGCWLLLPWRHRVRYAAERRDPFLVGGIHICPDHDPQRPVELRVPHQPEDPLHAVAWRRDARWPGLEGLVGGDLDDRPLLRPLAEWVVGRWTSHQVQGDQARAMAVMLVDVLAAAAAPPRSALPAPLARAVGLVRADLARAPALPALAAAAGCSVPTLVRLFRRHLGRSPMAWLRDERMQAAQRLLATTALPVAEVGRRIGVADPQRFTRAFRAAAGEAPRAWRVRRRL